MEPTKRSVYTDHQGVQRGFVTEDEAALCECSHVWKMLGGMSGYSACVKCGQAGFIVMEFEYLAWNREPLEGHV